MCYLLRTKLKMKIKKRTKQTTMDILLKRVTRSSEEPQAGPSGGLLGEDVVIPGDHSSTRVSAPEHPPGGRDVEGETVILMVLALWFVS